MKLFECSVCKMLLPLEAMANVPEDYGTVRHHPQGICKHCSTIKQASSGTLEYISVTPYNAQTGYVSTITAGT